MPIHRLSSSLMFVMVLITSSGQGPSAHAQGSAAPTPSTHSGHHADPNRPPSQNDATGELHQAMKAGMEAMQKVPMRGDVDKDFAAVMKVHHEQAVAMAEVELKHGSSPQMKAMAAKMIKAQKKEIEELSRWLKRQP